MSRGPSPRGSIPEAVRLTLDDFRSQFGVQIRLWAVPAEAAPVLLDPLPVDGDAAVTLEFDPSCSAYRPLLSRDGVPLAVEVVVDGKGPAEASAMAGALAPTLARILDYQDEVRFFTYEVSERYEEINLLYSISETLGSVLGLDAAARAILEEVCDVMGARRGSLWVHDPEEAQLLLVASVGAEGLEGPLAVEDPSAVTAKVFREGRAYIVQPGDDRVPEAGGGEGPDPESILSVPIRYTPPHGEARTVGVVNLLGHRDGEAFSASDQKLLAAIASQVGAALENNRLIRESLERERITRELELAHNLQMKLLPPLDKLEGARVAARVEPAESVGGDFYHVLRLKEGRVGVMVGDVSGHGFPAALIMALAMSAAAIYASEVEGPEEVLSHVDAAIREELQTTEMYLTLFYGVVDPVGGTFSYSSAGHPHAFLFRGGAPPERLPATDPPMGMAPEGEYQLHSVPWTSAEDLLFLFTDGLSDRLGAGTAMRGEDRLVEAVGLLRDRAPEEIVAELFALQPDRPAGPPPDDRTAVLLRA